MAAPDVPALTRLLVDPTETQDGEVVVERGEAALQLPTDRLRVGLVRGEDVLVRDLRRGPPAHRVEAGLGEFEARAFERDVRVRHRAQDTEPPTGPLPIFLRGFAAAYTPSPDLAQVVHHPYIAPS